MSADSGAGAFLVTHWNQLRSERGVPLSSAETVIRLAGTFVPPIDPFRFGLELFESPEHEGMASGLQLHFENSDAGIWSTSALFALDGGAYVSFMQTIALAGDFFGVPDAPISDGTDDADRQSRFCNAWRTLNMADPQLIANILAVMGRQGAAVFQAAQASTASDRYSQAYTQLNANYQYDLAYNTASGGGTVLSPEGSYMQLAGTNWDHFGHHAVAAYSAGHAVALAQAQQAGQQLSQAGLQRAYLMDAFASHFLADLFATGHLRTPRKALHDSLSPFPDLLSQIMHDEDNYNGMMVTSNLHPEGWLAYGDKRMRDDGNATNFAYSRAALQTSINEIWSAYTGVLPASYAALDYIPNLDSAFDTTNHNNWSPLFVVSQDDENAGNLSEVAIRNRMLDLTSRAWSTMDAWYVPASAPIYAAAWYALPSGGVHSVEGAPPYQLQQWAHPFAWSAYKSVRLDAIAGAIVKNAMSPAAVVVSDPSPPTVIADPSELPNHGDDVLHLFVRQSSSSAILHLTTPMSNVPSFATSCVQQPTDSSWVTSGQPAAIANNGTIAVLYPQSDGSIVQRVTMPNGLGWSSPTVTFGTSSSTYRMNAGGTVALAKSGSALFLAYRGSDGKLWCAMGKMPPNQCIWQMPVQVQIGGKPVSLSNDPGLIIFGNYLVVSASASTDGPNPVLIWRCPLDANPPFSAFELYLNGLKDSSRNALNVKNNAQLFDYADGYSVVGTDNSNDRMETIVPVQATNPTGSWLMKNIIVGGMPLKTTSRVSTVFYQGNPYIFYSDSGTSNQLSVVTSATRQVD